MKYLYAVRDVKADDINDQVMVCKADAVAVRSFSDALASTDPRSLMAKYPDDYELLELGAIHEDGRIESLESPRVVLTGTQWRQTRDAAHAANTGV